MLKSKLDEKQRLAVGQKNITPEKEKSVSKNSAIFSFHPFIPGEKFFKTLLISVGLILTMTLIFLGLIISQQSNQLISEKMENETKQNIHDMQRIIENQQQLFNVMAEAIYKNGKDKDRIVALINDFIRDSPFSLAGVAQLDGKALLSDGKLSNVSNETFFKIALGGERKITCSNLHKINEEKKLTYSAPLKYKGKTVGVLYAVYDNTKLEKNLISNSLNEDGFYRVIDKKGNIIVTTSLIDKVNNVTNVFDEQFEFKNIKNKNIGDKVKNDIQNGVDGLCILKNEETKKYVEYQNLGYNEWYIFSGVSDEYFNKTNISIKIEAIIAIIVIFISVIALITGILYHNRLRIKAMKTSEKQFDYILDGINGGVIMTTMEEGFPIKYASDGAEKMFGYETNGMLGLTNRKLTYTADAKRVYQKIVKVIREESDTIDVDYRRVKKDGSLIWINEKGKIIETLTGERILQSVITNIDKEKTNELNLSIKEQEYDIVLGKTKLILFSYDVINDTVKIHKNDTNVSGLPIEKVFSSEEMNSNIVMTDEYQRIILKSFDRMRDGEKKINAIIKLFCGDGVEQIIDIELNNIFDEFGNSVEIIGVSKDITHEYYFEKARKISRIIKSDIDIWFEIDIEDDSILDGSTEWLNSIGYTPKNSYSKSIERIAKQVIHEGDISSFKEIMSIEKLRLLVKDGITNQSIDYRRIEENDNYIWVNCDMKIYNDKITNKSKAKFVLKIVDITQKEKTLLAKKLECDNLTGVYTRETTEKILTEYFNSSIKRGISAMIVYDVSLDNGATDLNENNIMLKNVVENIRHIFRSDDVFGRIIKNKFCVFMRNISDRGIAIEKVKAIQKSVLALGYNISVGVSFSETEDDTYKNIYEKSDDARIIAKNSGKNLYRVYEE